MGHAEIARSAVSSVAPHSPSGKQLTACNALEFIKWCLNSRDSYYTFSRGEEDFTEAIIHSIKIRNYTVNMKNDASKKQTNTKILENGHCEKIAHIKIFSNKRDTSRSVRRNCLRGAPDIYLWRSTHDE